MILSNCHQYFKLPFNWIVNSTSNIYISSQNLQCYKSMIIYVVVIFYLFIFRYVPTNIYFWNMDADVGKKMGN